MAIPAIGIVAVLVANVTFVAWTTPPGEASFARTVPILILLFACISLTCSRGGTRDLQHVLRTHPCIPDWAVLLCFLVSCLVS